MCESWACPPNPIWWLPLIQVASSRYCHTATSRPCGWNCTMGGEMPTPEMVEVQLVPALNTKPLGLVKELANGAFTRLAPMRALLIRLLLMVQRQAPVNSRGVESLVMADE